MTDLKGLIATFNRENEGKFIGFLEEKNKRLDTKNIQLFRLLKDDELNQNEICLNIYGTLNKSAYYALRKRLYHSIIDFVAQLSLQKDNTIDMQLIKYIVAARSFLHQGKIDIGYGILDKAELLAKEHFLFSILNEIYHTKIQYAHLNESLNLNHFINELKSNKKNLETEDNLNIIYAKVRKTINKQTHSTKIFNIKELLDKLMTDHEIDEQEFSFKSLYQLIRLESIKAFAHNDYLHSETFLLERYKVITKQPQRPGQLPYHISVLYLIANAFFRNKKFEESIIFLAKMELLMNEDKKRYYENFILKHSLLLSLNLNFTGKIENAIKLVESLKLDKHNDLESVLDLNLSLVMYYIQNEEYKKALNVFKNFYHSDSWYIKKAGMDWLLKKNLLEILLHAELGNLDLVESRLISFKRSHFNYLRKINQERAIQFIKLVELYLHKPEIVETEKFKQKVENSFEWIGPRKEDIFVMSFYAWLKSKMLKTPLYPTTLKLIKESQVVK